MITQLDSKKVVHMLDMALYYWHDVAGLEPYDIPAYIITHIDSSQFIAEPVDVSGNSQFDFVIATKDGKKAFKLSCTECKITDLLPEDQAAVSELVNQYDQDVKSGDIDFESKYQF